MGKSWRLTEPTRALLHISMMQMVNSSIKKLASVPLLTPMQVSSKTGLVFARNLTLHSDLPWSLEHFTQIMMIMNNCKTASFATLQITRDVRFSAIYHQEEGDEYHRSG